MDVSYNLFKFLYYQNRSQYDDRGSKFLFQFGNMQYFEQGFFDNSRGKTYVDLHDRVKRRMEKRYATVTETCHACMLRNSGKQFYDGPIMI